MVGAMSLNIGFVSTRFAGTDGVSLESSKWADLLVEAGHTTYWYAGEVDRRPSYCMCIEEAHFQHEEVRWINRNVWGQTHRSQAASQRIRALTQYLKSTLYDFVARFEIDLLVLQNCVTIPMHIPLGAAIAEFLAETSMAAIAHHHDFAWERSRFVINAVPDYLALAFPPRGSKLRHTTINQAAQEQLSLRKGLSSSLTPNVFDFQNPPPQPDAYTANLRACLGFDVDDIIILQPTRIVPRKGIEHAIRLLEIMGEPRCKLVISHDAGDEGFEYESQLKTLALEANVDLRIIADRVAEKRGTDAEGRKMYTLWDLYPMADFVTYPSLYEGFGNALLEAVYFKKPVLVNRYDVFIRDIEPKGFRFPTMDGFVTQALAEEVLELLNNDEKRLAMTEHNYEVATVHYSYKTIRRILGGIIADLTHG